MWSDNETARDFLNFSAVADTVAEIIVQARGRPISIGVSGAWGVGKSSMIKLIRGAFAGRAEGCNGEFVLVEQRPRMQSRAEVVSLDRGDGVIFAVRHRPVQGKRGHYRVVLRHGVSRLRSGRRHTLGVIFHDAA